MCRRGPRFHQRLSGKRKGITATPYRTCKACRENNQEQRPTAAINKLGGACRAEKRVRWSVNRPGRRRPGGRALGARLPEAWREDMHVGAEDRVPRVLDPLRPGSVQVRDGLAEGRRPARPAGKAAGDLGDQARPESRRGCCRAGAAARGACARAQRVVLGSSFTVFSRFVMRCSTSASWSWRTAARMARAGEPGGVVFGSKEAAEARCRLVRGGCHDRDRAGARGDCRGGDFGVRRGWRRGGVRCARILRRPPRLGRSTRRRRWPGSGHCRWVFWAWLVLADFGRFFEGWEVCTIWGVMHRSYVTRPAFAEEGALAARILPNIRVYVNI